MAFSAEKIIRQALDQWMSALDALEDPIFIHDADFKILRCNRAYQHYANLPFNDIIGRPYYEIFPRRDAPLPHCLQSLKDPSEPKKPVEIEVGDAVFRSRGYAVIDARGLYQYSIHILEEITLQKQNERKLRENEAFIKAVLDHLPVGIAVNTVEPTIEFAYMNDNFPAIYRTTRDRLAHAGAFWESVYEDPKFRKTIKKRVLADCDSGDPGRMEWNDIPITRRGEPTTYISARNVRLEEQHAMVSMVWDVTERKRYEEKLEEANRFSETLIGGLPDIFFLVDAQGKLLRWNKRLEELIGLPEAQMAGTPALNYIHEEDRDRMARKIGEVLEYGSASAEARMIFSGGIRTYALSGSRIETPAGVGVIGFGIDITERKEAETQLRLERDFSERLVNTAPAVILVLDPLGRIVRFNRYMEQLSGYTLGEVIGKEWFATFLPAPERARVKRLFQKVKGDIDGQGIINTILTRSGETRQVEWYNKTLKDAAGNVVSILAVGLDVTERLKADEALKTEAMRRRILMEKSYDGIAIIDARFRVIEANSRFAQMLGYTPQELEGMAVWEFDAMMDAEEIQTRFADLLHINLTFETYHRRKDGTIYSAEVSASGALAGDEPMVFTIVRDITERKRSEAALQRANRALQTLSAGNLALVRADDETQLLQSVADVIIEKGGYDLSAVCFADDDPDQSIRSVVWAGTGDEHYCTDLHLSWGEREEGQLPLGRAIRDSRTQVCRDLLHENAYRPWKEALVSHGFISNIALPLTEGGRTFGALSIYSKKNEVFDAEEVHLLEELANDLAYGIINLRTQAEHDRHARLLRQSLEQSVQTIAATLEARDPYTAGHQRRVAELATAIAREMGLDDDRVQGIHFAAIIHDLGKIHIPAEILSNPGRLNKIEHMLIQTHPQEGYEILKEVEFPWPIAQIVLQHHEKLDGSGYPQGLTADQILPEAKIICVADVVEAMSSHRPYRPGLGLEAALAEITRGRGTAYDAVVVDICLKLFGEKGFAFSDEG